MNITPQQYNKMAERATEKSRVCMNTVTAFLTGGAICTVGQFILKILNQFTADRETAAAFTSIILVAASALLTGTGIYEKLAKHAGAGTLVPITGFANAVVSPAIEAKTEGLVLGVGTKIFSIAGPVILYGTAASFIYGLIYYMFL